MSAMARLVFAAVALFACGSSIAQQGDVAPPTVAPVATAAVVPTLPDVGPPPPDKAQIVFLKPVRGIYGAMPAAIYEVDGDTRKLHGVLNEDARLVVEVAPGKHRFMANMMAFAHFLDADVEAGKRYFVVTRFIYAQGFQLRPVRPGTASDYDAGQPTFARWLADTSVLPVQPRQLAWFAKKDAKIAKAQVKGEQAWLRKTDAERAELTLRPGDAL